MSVLARSTGTPTRRTVRGRARRRARRGIPHARLRSDSAHHVRRRARVAARGVRRALRRETRFLSRRLLRPHATVRPRRRRSAAADHRAGDSLSAAQRDHVLEKRREAGAATAAIAGRRRDSRLGPHDSQTTAHRRQPAVAPGRSVLGADTRLSRARLLDAARQRNSGKRLHVDDPGLAPRRHRSASSPQRRSKRRGTRNRHRPCARPRSCLAADAGRRRGAASLPHVAHVGSERERPRASRVRERMANAAGEARRSAPSPLAGGRPGSAREKFGKDLVWFD